MRNIYNKLNIFKTFTKIKFLIDNTQSQTNKQYRNKSETLTWWQVTYAKVTTEAPKQDAK